MRMCDWSSGVCSSDLDTHARENAKVPARNLAELEGHGKEPFPLDRAAPRERTLDRHERAERGRLPPRHQLLSEQVADPFDPEAPGIDVDFLAYQLHIVTSLDVNAEVLLQNCEHCKFAEIVQTAPGKYKLAGDYVPPSVALAASSNLLRWTRAMRDLLVSRGQDFAAAKRQRGIRAASTSAQEVRSEEHTSELQSLMRISYAVFCLKKKKIKQKNTI